MAHFDPGNSRLRVYIARAGLLSAVGHDLEIAVDDYGIDVDESALAVHARVASQSLQVVDAVQRRELRPGTLSAKDKEQIKHNMTRDVLETDKYPSIEFRSSRVQRERDGYRVRGELTLHGARRELEFFAQRRGSMVQGEIEIHQPDFGIAPYRALGGALRVRPEVSVTFELPDLLPQDST